MRAFWVWCSIGPLPRAMAIMGTSVIDASTVGALHFPNNWPRGERDTMGSGASLDAVPGVASARPGRFTINLVSNLGQLGLTMVLGAWYVPFLVRQLGPAAYGLIPLAGSITSYMALITLRLNSAVGRYLTIALEQKDDRRASLIFNTSLWGNLALTAVLLGLAAVGMVYLNRLIRVPLGF